AITSPTRKSSRWTSSSGGSAGTGGTNTGGSAGTASASRLGKMVGAIEGGDVAHSLLSFNESLGTAPPVTTLPEIGACRASSCVSKMSEWVSTSSGGWSSCGVKVGGSAGLPSGGGVNAGIGGSAVGDVAAGDAPGYRLT